VPSAAELVARMIDLVPLPQAYARIREAVDDPDSDLRRVAEIVKSDPALAGRVLRLVNSAYIGLMTPIDSIDHAVRVLGMRQIHDMALATSAVGSLDRLRGAPIDIVDFWRLSIYCAATAREVGTHARLPAPERMFVTGLLHNVGNLVLAHELPDWFRECHAQARASARPLADVQREQLGYDYAETGAELLRQWNLPAGLVLPILLHTRAIATLTPEERAPAAVLAVAAVTARATSCRSADSEPVPEYDATALTETGIEAEMLEEIMLRVDASVVEALAVLLPNR